MKHQVNVLIVDSREMYDIMAPTLREELHPEQLTHCLSTEEAMSAIKEGVKYDMIFADWTITGAGFVAAVRNSFANHYAPLVVTATDDNDELLGQVMRSGATDLLVKPFLKKGLVAKIRRITQAVERRRHHRVVLPEPLAVNAQLEGQRSAVRTAAMEMVDISADGCKAKLAAACNAQIYDRAKLSFAFRDSEFEMGAHLIRLEADPALARSGAGHMFASFLFGEMSDGVRDNLNQLLDEFSEYERQG